MIEILEKLHFNPGDFLIFRCPRRDSVSAAFGEAVAGIVKQMPFPVPYIFLEPGEDISKITRQDLEKLLRELP